MKKWMLCIGLGIWILLSGCGAPGRNTLFQTSTINALLAGVYDGDISCLHLLEHGDFGIGTFDRLEGEMVILEEPSIRISSTSFFLRFPDSKDFAEVDLSRDRNKDLKDVERGEGNHD